MRSTLSIFDITQIDIKQPRQDNVNCQHITFSSEDGQVLDLTIFGETFICTPRERNLALREKTRAAMIKGQKTTAIAQISVALKNADTIEWLDAGHIAPFKMFARRFCDLAANIYDQHTRAKASATRRQISSVLDELFKDAETIKWMDGAEAEVSLCNALIQAFWLFEWDPDTEAHRFGDSVTAFWMGWGWASALAHSERP